MQSIHRVKGTAPWGDYGKILAHGMTAHLGRTSDGRLQLERTGPFLPAVTAPGFSVLVTADLRERIEAAGLTGVEFREVEKARIVRCDWERWDRQAPEPPELPKGGSPEGYVLQRPHDEALAAELGPVFEVLALGSCSIDVQKIEHPPAPDAAPKLNPFTGKATPAKGRVERIQRLEAADGSDFLLSGKSVFVSDRARALLESEWLRFETIGG